MCREYKLDVSTGAVSCYSAPMVNLIWFADDKFLKFYNNCSHKNVESYYIYVSGDSLTFTCSSKTLHQHTELAR